MKKYIPYIVIAVLLVSLIVSLTNRKGVSSDETTSDTVTIVKVDTVYDTIYYKMPTFISEVIVDTFWLKDTLNNAYMIPKTVRYYKDSTYEAWVSGYKPSLDSINTFGKTIYTTVTNTITKEIYPKRVDWFLNAGVDYVSGGFAPNIGAAVKFRNDILLGGHVGYLDKGVYYGVKIGYKLNK